MHDRIDTDAVLNRMAGLAARMAGVSSAAVRLGGAVRGGYGDVAAGAFRGAFRVERPFRAAGVNGTLVLHDARRRRPLTPAEGAGLDDLLAVIAAVLEQDRQGTLLAEATDRAVRADVILRLVAEAPSCAGALTSLLEELCRHHDATVGRIWRLLADGTMLEESRYNGARLDAASYYHMPPAAPVRAGNSRTAQAILRNRPEAFIYSQVEDPERFVLLKNAMASGLASQVSFPIWIGEERFGVALAFGTERTDLGAVVADIASLANTIRPALFRKVTEERAYHLAHHDGLTQLSNRTAFNERIAAAVQRAAAEGSGFSLLYLDLDGFKAVNDTHGHEAGDRLLVLVAQRLRACVRDSDRVARLGGDEFAIIQPSIPENEGQDEGRDETGDPGGGDTAGGVALARRLLDRFNEPFTIDGRHLDVGTSIGIARFPADGATPDQLLRSADLALYECKRSGRRTFRVFDARLGARQHSRATAGQELEAALDAGQLGLAFQPICALPGRDVHGLEALPQWRHAERGVLSMTEFMPAADAMEVSGLLGRWMLEAACRAAAGWGTPRLLSVNVLPNLAREPAGLVAEVAAVLQATGLPPGRLDLEVPEHVLLADTSLVRTLCALKELGVRVTLDGFGAAHAGLGWLRRITFDRIKLDPSFTTELGDPGTLALLRAVLVLGRNLGVEVVADGVETEAELDVLARLGCRLAQGPVFGRPGPADTTPQLAPRCGMEAAPA